MSRVSLSAGIKVWLTVGKQSLGFNHVNLDGFDADAKALEPFDRGFDFGAYPLKFEAYDADLTRHASLSDVGHHIMFLANSQTWSSDVFPGITKGEMSLPETSSERQRSFFGDLFGLSLLPS